MKVNILGTEYSIDFKDYKDDETFSGKEFCGYTDDTNKEICICNMKTYPNYEKENKEFIEKMEKEIMRHEIVHAFFSESGLKWCANQCNTAWAKNEEMVDWIAIQSPKIFKAFNEVGCM